MRLGLLLATKLKLFQTNMKIQAFFDLNTSTVSCIVIDEATSKCAIIDSVLDYDIFSGRTNHQSANILIAFINLNTFYKSLNLDPNNLLTSASSSAPKAWNLYLAQRRRMVPLILDHTTL